MVRRPIIELFRLGYGFTSDVDSPPIGSDDAYYLFYCLYAGDELDPLFLEGIVWAAKNRRVDWGYQLWCAQQRGNSERLDLVMSRAGHLHLKSKLTNENGKLKPAPWMQIPDEEKQALNVKLTAKVAAMSEEERGIRWDEMISAPESYESSLEFVKLLFGPDGGLAD